MRLGAGTGAKQVRTAPVGCYQSTENSSILEKEKFRIPKGKHLTGEAETSGTAGIGAARHWMSVVSPYGQVNTHWNARLVGDLGEIADILLGGP